MLKLVQRKDSPSWWIRGTVKVGHSSVKVYESTGLSKTSKLKGKARELAEKKQKSIEEELMYGRSYVATYQDAALLYMEAGGSPRYQEKLINQIGAVRLKDISQEFLNKQADIIYPDCLPETINRQFWTPFIAVWRHNSKGQNPLCQLVEWSRPKIKAKKKAMKSRSYEEATTFINAMDEPAARVMFFLFWTGCRPIEAFLLDKSDVDIEGRWIVLSDTKTGSPRGVPLHEGLVPMMRDLCQGSGKVFRVEKGDPYKVVRKYNKQGRIIQNRSGQIKKAVTTAKIKTELDINPYSARHTVSTELIARGVPKLIKDTILGHSETDVSLEYVHLPNETYIEAINKLPDPKKQGIKLI